MTGQGVLAQPGLKATLQALSAGVVYPTSSLQKDEDFIAVHKPLAGFHCYSTVADFFIRAVGLGYISPHLFPF